MLVLQRPIAGIGLSLLGGSEDVTLHARHYFYIKIWGAPAQMCLFAMTGWFIGMHNVRTVLAISVVLNLINILLDLLFVVVLEMDVEGVALASVIAEYSGLALALSWRGAFFGTTRACGDGL